MMCLLLISLAAGECHPIAGMTICPARSIPGFFEGAALHKYPAYDSPYMDVTNQVVAGVLAEIGDLLEVHGENPFKVRAYARAAETVRHLGRPVAGMDDDDFEALPGIGKVIAGNIAEIVETGTCQEQVRLREATPPGLPALLNLRGVGPKTVHRFWKELGVTGIDDLETAARAHRIRGLRGFGEKKEDEILRAVAAARKVSTRMSMTEAERLAERVLLVIPGEAWVAGSLRRGRSTIGDIDVVTLAPAAETALALEGIADEVIDAGEKKISVRIDEIRIDVRFSTSGDLGAMLLYLTGSKGFNIRLREVARSGGMRLNEYGLTDQTTGELRSFGTEDEVFTALGMVLVPPELREDRGEVDLALAGHLPRVVEAQEIRGDLHLHSEWSDGSMSLDEIALVGESRGYEYILVSDHSASLGIAHGLDADRLACQHQAIREVNRTLGSGCTLLAGVEVDILADGRLALPDRVLQDCDLVVASVHSGFGQAEDVMTRRVITAIEKEHVDIIGHPTGRVISRRPPVALDMGRVIGAAAENGKALEINASPGRFDLDDIYIKQAQERGVKLAIGTDAHAPSDLDHIRHGVTLARRGWCGAGDILNTMSLVDLMEWRG
ncbi:DNA polymerase (family 10) [Methanofollis sp. W23]|uniref:DNA polymerase/3'-5' exonuclease PolX n=1 Tax=Methanofollis sp. W23 TaxID=2817849 RepID=UPI001D6887A4|nr:DNA polymerase/3'-5' exonuclease PolX [Methanofollis sp. W23]MBP2147106.1 DNA polymerase (family 10) [Methanofollis sp. W23]